MKSKAIVILTLIGSITACGGSSSNTATEAESLPSGNSSLDTQTPAGIWFLHSAQTGNYTVEDVDTNIDTIKEVQQFVVISEQPNGNFLMPGCGLDLFTINKSISLNVENSQIKESGTSLNVGNDEETYTMNLSLQDNLALTGTIAVIKQNASPVYIYKNEKIANISAIKVSDSTSFESAKELAIVFNAQLNNEAELALADMIPAVSCLAISSASYSGTQLGQTVAIKKEVIHLTDTEDKGAEFESTVGNLGSEVIANKNYGSFLTFLQSSGSSSCADDDETCVLTNSLVLNQGANINGITASTRATNENDESLTVSFSVGIDVGKP